jgi:hypothetical protein
MEESIIIKQLKKKIALQVLRESIWKWINMVDITNVWAYMGNLIKIMIKYL